MRQRKPAPATGTGSQLTTTATESSPVVTEFDFDKAIVDAVNKELWVALFDGDFRLAVPCDVCGRWLTAGNSKRAHRGKHCAAKAAGR